MSAVLENVASGVGASKPEVRRVLDKAVAGERITPRKG